MRAAGVGCSPHAEEFLVTWSNSKFGQTPSTMTRWRDFHGCPASGGIHVGRWPPCTNSIQCGLAISATGPPRISIAIQTVSIVLPGCGGGILAEPLARLGAIMVGIDPSESNVSVAQHHAAQSRLAIDYRATTAEALVAAGEKFDVVLAMEVVEHVTDLGLFADSAAAMVKSGGLLFVATLNRTIKSFALAIVGAEYVLRWLPRGTHQWDKFVTPNELEIAIEQSGLHLIAETGVIYNLFADRWQLSSDMDVNYMVVAEKPA